MKFALCLIALVAVVSTSVHASDYERRRHLGEIGQCGYPKLPPRPKSRSTAQKPKLALDLHYDGCRLKDANGNLITWGNTDSDSDDDHEAEEAQSDDKPSVVSGTPAVASDADKPVEKALCSAFLRFFGWCK